MFSPAVIGKRHVVSGQLGPYRKVVRRLLATYLKLHFSQYICLLPCC